MRLRIGTRGSALALVQARGGMAEPGFEREDFLGRVAEIFAEIDRDYIAHIDGSGEASAVEAAALAVLRMSAS